jgi:hypothetical protein
MILDFTSSDSAYYLAFKIDDIKTDKHLQDIITAVCCFSMDFELDPELEVEDLQEIIDKTYELENDKFTICISEDGIEADI